MKTLAQIHEEVTNLLENNAEKVTARRTAVRAIKLGIGRPVASNGYLRRRKAWFSTAQGQAKEGKASANVQLLGLDVGKIFLDNGHWWFVPSTKFPKYAAKRWKWSNSSKDSNAIRNFLKTCEQDPRADPWDEREIQWRIAYALKHDKQNDALRNVQPVTWNNYFTEVGVSVRKDGKIGTGNIDLVVRRGEGSDKGFLVFEIKRPGAKDFEKALVQSLRYATALDFEANRDNTDRASETRADYRTVFGAKGAKDLAIGAVVVMDESAINADAACRDLRACY